MNTTPDITAGPGSSSQPAPATPLPQPVPVIVQASADAAPEGRASAKGRSAAKAASATADRGAPVAGRLSEQFSPDVEASPAAAGKTPMQIALAFAGLAAEEQPAKVKPSTGNPAAEAEEEDTGTEDDSEIETDGSPEGQDNADAEEEEAETEATEEEPGEEAETADTTDKGPLAGIVKAMTEKGLGKLAKRVTAVFADNGTLKAELAQARQAPPVVLQADGAEVTPFAKAATPEEVDAQAQQATAQVRGYLRWLARHPEGGVHGEGTDRAVRLTAEQVEAETERWESYMDDLPNRVSQRKAWLTKYDAAVKSLEVPVSEFLKPKVETRESKLLKAVPELARDPEFAAFLADARAGRELREKKAGGQVPIFVDAAKARAKQQAAAAGKGSPDAAGKGRSVTAARPTNGAARGTDTVASLRAIVEQGGPGARAAADKLALMMAA